MSDFRFLPRVLIYLQRLVLLSGNTNVSEEGATFIFKVSVTTNKTTWRHSPQY